MKSNFYSPYFSAKQIYPPSLELDLKTFRELQLREEQAEIQLAIRLRQQQLASDRIRQYQQELRSKQNPKHYLESPQFKSSITAEEIPWDLKENFDHSQRNVQLKNVEEMKKDRSFLDERKKGERQQGQKQRNRKRQQYQNQRKIEQYQQELLSKIQRCIQHRPKKQRTSLKKSTQTFGIKSNQLRRFSHTENNNIIINKKVKKKDPKSNTFTNHQIVGKLNNFGQIQTSQLWNINHKNFQTLDIDHKKTKNKHTFNNRDLQTHSSYLTERKQCKSQKRKASITHNRTAYELCEKDSDRHNEYKIKLSRETLSVNALKKIENRLRLSQIVFRDSKWSHNRYQMEHLTNTYEMEERGRTQIKKVINNHPKILKKHTLVASSR